MTLRTSFLASITSQGLFYLALQQRTASNSFARVQRKSAEPSFNRSKSEQVNESRRVSNGEAGA